MRLRQSFLAIMASMSLMLFAAIVASGQERPVWGPAVSFPNGTFIQTGIGTIPSGVFGMRITSSVVTAASTEDQGIFRRILKLSDGRAIVYEVAVKRLAEGRRFQVTLRSWVPSPEEARESNIDPARLDIDFLNHYSSPISINEGDMLALDVLRNPHTRVKLVDYFRITSRPPVLSKSLENLAATARPIEIGDIEFFIQNFDLRLNGKPIYSSQGGMGGRFIWLDVPQTGRFIFSLTPLSEVDGFHRSAYLMRQQIVFTNGPDKYELTSERPIVSALGVFNLWVRLDPTFTFPSVHQAGSYFSVGAADHLPLLEKRQ